MCVCGVAHEASHMYFHTTVLLDCVSRTDETSFWFKHVPVTVLSRSGDDAIVKGASGSWW